MKLSEKIVALRKSNAMSQEELAERLNVTRQAVSRWEGGSAMPDAANILLISKLFGVTADYLLNEDYTSDNDIPKVIEAKEDNLKTIRFYLVALEIMVLILQFMTVVILESVFFSILSFIPFVAVIGGFEYGYRKRADKAKETERRFRKGFYKISIWLGAYFPVRLLVTVAIQLLGVRYSAPAFECVIISIYMMVAICMSLTIEKLYIDKNK